LRGPSARGGDIVSASADAEPASRGRRRITGWRAWLLRVALLVAAPAVLLGLLEACLRLFGYGYPTDFLLPCDSGRAWTANRQFAWRFTPPSPAIEPDFFKVPAEKPPGTCRIFILGESAAMGVPDPAYSFGRMLGVMLRDRHPGVRFEVVNAAVMGIDSHAILPIARSCARGNPDVLVIYMGNNEAVGPCSPMAAPSQAFSLSLTRAGIAAKTTRVGQLARSAMRVVCPAPDETGPQTIETFLAKAVPPGDPRLATMRDHFRANLDDILRAARAAGARAVVATVVTNLRDCAPLASLHRADLSEGDRAGWERLVRAGDAEESAGRQREAASAYEAALKIDGRHADLHFRFARCLLTMGRAADARRHFIEARDLDALPFRATTALNEAVRETAGGRQDDGIHLADAERAFEMDAGVPHGIPGEESVYEHVHLTFEGNWRLARSVLPAVEAAMPDALRGAAGAPVPSYRRCAEMLAFSDRDRARLAGVIARCQAKPPFTNQSDYAWRDGRMRREAADLAARLSPESDARAEALYAAALARSPGDWRLHRNLGSMREERGDFAAAAEQFRAIVDEFPCNLEAQVRLADSLARLGRNEEAVAHYTEALRLRDDCLPARRGLAGVLVMQGRPEEAAGHAARAAAVEVHAKP
jgi:tetratricopeptide (TPR) repeat protein